jgi:FkbM family methyltransferase
MSVISRIRHSIIGWSVRKVIHAGYRLQNPPGKPVRYSLPGGFRVQLYPEGQVAEFLAVQRFFEKTELMLVAAYLKPGMTVVDVGANVGLYSILAEKMVGPTGTVWAFEPSLESYQRLERNLQLNGCSRVTPVRAALSTQAEGFLQLKSDAGFGDAYRYLAPTTVVDPGNPHSEWVPVTTLDAFSRQEKIGSATFLKIDVEGGEYAVFQGARDFLRSSPNVCIMFESDPEWCRRAGCRQEDSFELLAQLGFRLYAWHNRSRKWMASEKALLAARTVWATRESARLPVI